MNKVTVQIEGMMCGMCEAHVCDIIRRAVHTAKRVKASKIRKEATFITEIDVNENELKKAIADTGYTVISVSSEPYKKRGLFGWL